MCAQRFNIVVFGATGFTGKYVIEEIARTIDEEKNLKWAVAGRSSAKLKEVLLEAEKNTGKSLANIPIIVTDIKNESSLNNMCSKAEIILNCVGPYRFYGEPVIKACIANKCHHLDISGEPGFLDKILLEYDEAAKKAGVCIVGACGWDSIPNEMGVAFVKKKFSGDLNWVESYVSIKTASGGGFNFGTYQSAVHCAANWRADLALQRAIQTQAISLPKPVHTIPKRGPLFKSAVTGDWCIPFTGPDEELIQRTQRFCYANYNERPVQFKVYNRMPSLVILPLLFVSTLFIALLSQFSIGCWLLETYPRLFTLGLCSSSGPSREAVSKSTFTMTFIGEGYSSKISDPSVQHTEQPNKQIKARISGPELAYIATPICLVQAAYVILAEKDKLPTRGGVFSPGAAFSRTSLIDRLNNHGIKFELIIA